MGIGHKHRTQKFQPRSFYQTDRALRYCHGGVLRQRRKGRLRRPLSGQYSLHVVFKVNTYKLRQLSLRSPQTHKIIQKVILRYSKKFFVKIEQMTIQNDHIHLLVRTTRRSQFIFFFRVASGQMAQVLQKEGLLRVIKSGVVGNNVTDTRNHRNARISLWRYRPFSRIIKGYTAYRRVRNYIQLNYKEAIGQIKYNKLRLRGLSSADWQILWSS